jgi:uncharacterized protein YjbI with pentapeptide repeats
MRTLVSIAAVVFAFSNASRAGIFQWEYINPADPSQGKQQSTTLAPDGAGVDLVPGANLGSRNLTMAYLIGADLSGANFSASFQAPSTVLTDADLSQANLTNASFYLAVLTYADFGGADVRGANFGSAYYPVAGSFGTGISLPQLYSTASYQTRELSGIRLQRNYLAGGNFAGQNLQGADFGGANLRGANFREADLADANFGECADLDIFVGCGYRAYDITLTDADFTDANLSGASFQGALLANANFTGARIQGATFDGVETYGPEGEPGGFAGGITLTQLYSTASYHEQDLSGIRLGFNYLAGGNFAGQKLTGASFSFALLTDTDFTDADIRDASFAEATHCGRFFCNRVGVLTLAQLYSTDSYKAHDLSGISLGGHDFIGGDFAGQNLTNASFYEVTLTDADFNGADVRGASVNFAGAVTTNLIRSDGHVIGLDLNAGSLLIVRDYDGDSRYEPARTPIPIRIDQHLAMGPAGTLRIVFDADAWDSTISFAPGIPVALGGTLELTFAADANPATQLGRTFDLFNWTGVAPIGAFAISSPYAWDLSNLYTSGEVTLTSVPEPSALLLFGFALAALVAIGRV